LRDPAKSNVKPWSGADLSSLAALSVNQGVLLSWEHSPRRELFQLPENPYRGDG
jgi:hypothetical protein